MSDAKEFAALQCAVTLLEANLAHEIALTLERFEQRDNAVDAALSANDKRLDGMNEFRSAMADISRQMVTRVESDAVVGTLSSKVTSDMRLMNDKLDAMNRPNYILGVSALSAVLIAIGGLWTVTGLKIDNAISPYQVTMEQLKSNLLGHDKEFLDLEGRLRDVVTVTQENRAGLAQSVVDRAQLNERVLAQENALVRHETEYQAKAAALDAMVTRLNVWLDFVHAKVFPSSPAPPLKQP